MKCKYSKLLNRYVDDRLVPEDKSFVDRHIISCDLCARELDTILKIKMALSSIRAESDSEQFLGELKTKIELESVFLAQKQNFVFDFNNWAKRLMPVPVAFALAVIIMLNLLSFNTNLVDEYIFGTSFNNAYGMISGESSKTGVGSLLF